MLSNTDRYILLHADNSTLKDLEVDNCPTGISLTKEQVVIYKLKDPLFKVFRVASYHKRYDD